MKVRDHIGDADVDGRVILNSKKKLGCKCMDWNS
jgi:hypothetical protein